MKYVGRVFSYPWPVITNVQVQRTLSKVSPQNLALSVPSSAAFHCNASTSVTMHPMDDATYTVLYRRRSLTTTIAILWWWVMNKFSMTLHICAANKFVNRLRTHNYSKWRKKKKKRKNKEEEGDKKKNKKMISRKNRRSWKRRSGRNKKSS